MHLDISRAVTAESSPLHIAISRTRTGNREPVSERKSLTTKLRVLRDTYGNFSLFERFENQAVQG